MIRFFMCFFVCNFVSAQTVRLKPVQVIAYKNITDFLNEQKIKQTLSDGNLADALNRESDVQVVRSGGTSGITSIFLRGGNSNQTAVTKDGINLFNTVDASLNMGNALLQDTVVTVVKGPLSAKYGADAIMGIVRMVTPDPILSDDHVILLEAGKFYHQKTAYIYENAKDGQGIRFRVNQQSIKGIPSTPVIERTSLIQGKAEGKEQQDFSLLFVYLLQRDWKIKSSIEKDLFVTKNCVDFPAPVHLMQSDIQQDTLNFSIEQTDRSFWAPTLRLNHQFYHVVDHDTGSQLLYRQKRDSSIVNAAFENAFYTKHDVIHLNIDMREESFEQLSPPNHRINKHSLGTGVVHQWEENAKSEIWCRYNRTNRSHHSQDLSIEHQVTFENVTFFGMFGLAHRAPTLMQLYDVNSGNTQLRSEKNTGFSGGYRWTVHNFKCTQSYFQNYLTDMIVVSGVAPFRSQNLSHARTEGVETDLSYQLSSFYTYVASYTYLLTKDLTTQRRLLRRPMHKIVQHIWYADDDWRIGFGATTITKQLDFDRNGFGERRYRGGYTVADITAEYTVQKNMWAYGKIENALARRYQLPLGFEQPGFSFLLGLKVRLS